MYILDATVKDAGQDELHKISMRVDDVGPLFADYPHYPEQRRNGMPASGFQIYVFNRIAELFPVIIIIRHRIVIRGEKNHIVLSRQRIAQIHSEALSSAGGKGER